MTEKEKSAPSIEELGKIFEARLEAVFMVLVDKAEPRGAKAWLARLCDVNTSTVSRWMGVDPIPGPVMALLRELEVRADMVAILEAPSTRGRTYRSIIMATLQAASTRGLS